MLRFSPPTAPPAFPWLADPATGNGAAVYSNTGLTLPDVVTIGKDGQVYVTDSGFTPGEVVQFAGPTATNAGAQLSPANKGWAAVFNPVAVAFDPSGNVVVANQSGNMIEEFNSTTGAYIKTLVLPNYIAFNGGLDTPTDIAFNNGNLFVSSFGSNAVLEYNGTTGAFLNNYTSAQTIADPEGLAFDSSNRLYVADGTNNDVLMFSTPGGAGTVFVTNGQGGLKRPRGLAFDSSGNLYVASNANNEVLRYSPTGANDPAAGGQGAFFAGGNAAYTDPTTGATQSDNYYGNVYVAWTTNDILQPNSSESNSNNIKVVGSSDGGKTFSDQQFLNQDGQYNSPGHDYTPQLVVSGLSGQAGAGGVLTAVWDNNPGSGTTDNITTNQVSDGVASYVATGQGGTIADAIKGQNERPGQPQHHQLHD